MQIDGKQIKDKSIDFGEKIKIGPGVVIDFGDSKIISSGEPISPSDIVNKHYVDSLSNSSNYIQPCDYISTVPITNFTKMEIGKTVLCVNAGTPGIYTFNGSKFVKTTIWTDLLKTLPNAGIIPVIENGCVYIFKANSNTDIQFTKIPQNVVSYNFGYGLTTEDRKIVVNTNEIATVENINELQSAIDYLVNNPLKNVVGENGVYISENKIGLNIETPMYIEENVLKIQRANIGIDGLMSSQDYYLLHTLSSGNEKDWSENNSGSSRYIQNRPFYKEDVEVLSINNSLSRGNYFTFELQLQEGVTYALNTDSETLYAICELLNDGGSKVCNFSNGITFEQTTGMSSVKVTNSSYNPIYLVSLLDKDNGNVKTLDPEYLPEIIIDEVELSDPNFAKEYALKIEGVQSGVTIKIPKDKVIEDAGSGVTTEEDIAEGGKFGPGTDYEGLFMVGDIYLYLVIYVGGSPSDKTIYININHLVDVYRGSNTIDVVPKTDETTGRTYQEISVAEDLPLVKPSISSTWIYDDTTVTGNSISVEEGTSVDYSGVFRWTNSETTKEPTSTSGDWGSILPTGTSMEFSSEGITTNRTFSQSIFAPKKGLEVAGTKVVKATGEDKETASASVTFGNYEYFGAADNIEEATIKAFSDKALQTSKGSRTRSNVVVSDTEFYIFAYPKAFGALSSIIQNGALPVLDAFDISEATFTNGHDATVEYYIYKSKQYGAFKGVKLEFKY